MRNQDAVILRDMFAERGIRALVNSIYPGQDMNIVELIVPAPWELVLMPIMTQKLWSSWTDEEYEAWLDSIQPEIPQGEEEYEWWLENQERMAVKTAGLSTY